MNLSKHFFRYIIISILFVILFCFIKPTVKEKFSLFDSNIATFEDDRGAYDQKDAEGFIKINALRMRIAAKQIKK